MNRFVVCRAASWVIPIALVSACGGEDLRFSKTFLFGSAIAGFQAEMGCPTVSAAQCEDRNSDWYVWITRPELVSDTSLYLSGDPPSSGPGFFELYAHDLDRVAAELHGNALRFSIEWSRIFPTSTVGISGYDALKQAASPAGLAFYHSLLSEMKSRHIVPLVTLNHYSLPTWIHDAYGCHRNLATCSPKGWVDSVTTVAEIAKYAGFVAREFGGDVDLWATLNEPLSAVALAGYVLPSAVRTQPPGLSFQTDAVKTVTQAMIEAHARMYDAVHLNDTVDADGDGKAARVGIVYNLETVAPLDATAMLDVQGAKNFAYLLNQLFLDGVLLGQLDAQFTGQPVHRDDLAGRADFLGVNYYEQDLIEGFPDSFMPNLSPLATFNPFTIKRNDAYAKGLYDVLMWASKRYQLPLIVTETGVPDPNDDGSGGSWIVQTLTWTRRAIRDGAQVEGYFYWTLMDNYEWNHGMEIRMGLYGVEKADPQKIRKARRSVPLYGRIAAAGQIPGDLASQYPVK